MLPAPAATSSPGRERRLGCRCTPLIRWRHLEVGRNWPPRQAQPGLSVWQENDPVHLTSVAYKDIACLIQHQAGSLVLGAPASGLRRINSIIPGQPQASAPAVVSVPGWISGTEAGRADRGRGGRGQRWNRGRGRGNRSYPY